MKNPHHVGRASSLLVFLFLLSWVFLAVAVVAKESGSEGANFAAQPKRFAADVTPTCTPVWQIVNSPNIGTQRNQLADIDAIRGDQIWAVGYYRPEDGTHSETLTQRWDGNEWSIIPSANGITDDSNLLLGVSALSDSDVWAVGLYNSPDMTFVEHWNGTEWQVVSTPDLGSSSLLNGVDAISPNDIWAVGTYIEGQQRTLTQHWNGNQWSVVPSPNLGNYSELWDVYAVSPTEVWAVGFYDDGPSRTLIMLWDGTQWNVVPSPNAPGASANILSSVSGTGSNDIWAVGYQTYGTLTLHWDGITWSLVPSLSPPEHVEFNAVKAIAPNDAWAVGYTTLNNSTLTAHWDGTSWTVVPSPNAGFANTLRGVAAVSNKDVWTVGYYTGDFATARRTLILRYSDPCQPPPPTRTPSRTPTHTSTVIPTPSHTVTGTPPTATPTPTPTACSLTFNDVPNNHTFYNEIRCLACRGVLGGYADGSFRPGADITRGQISKVVSNAAGFSEPVSGQTFEDVPPSNTFYEWIERLTTRGVMSGYACGGPGEPCVPPLNRPYFRPGANATRGQLSKIVANAANITDPVTGQFYQDVPTTHTFYLEIMRLTVRGVMGGYACGGVGEPCVPPENRPYFRPGANVTRGQASKIVANTFFPGCQTP